MDIFDSSSGNVVVSKDTGYPAVIELAFEAGEGGIELPPNEFSLIKTIRINKSSVFQLTKSLKDYIYINTFGSSDFSITVEGMAFYDKNNTNIGIIPFLKFFDKYNVNSVGEGDKIPKVSVQIIGGPNYSGLLVDAEYTIESGQSASLFMLFSLKLIGVVDKRTNLPAGITVPQPTGFA